MSTVGRPRKKPAGADIILGFKASAELVRALDQEAEFMTADRPPGSAKISRTELIKVALHDWLAARTKARESK